MRITEESFAMNVCYYTAEIQVNWCLRRHSSGDLFWQEYKTEEILPYTYRRNIIPKLNNTGTFI